MFVDLMCLMDDVMWISNEGVGVFLFIIEKVDVEMWGWMIFV